MTTTPDCLHSFPDPYPQPIDQPGDCRTCGISYQEAKDAAMTNPSEELRADPEPDDEDDGPHCRTVQP